MVRSASEPVVRDVRINASPEVVFSFFVDPARMVLWKGSDAMLDPRPGGVYRTVVSKQSVIRGEYLEVVPYSRIVFTFGWESPDGPIPPGGSTVEVTFTADGDGTVVHLVHSGLLPEQALPHAEGWDHFLDRLVIVAAGGDAGPDPWADASVTPVA